MLRNVDPDELSPIQPDDDEGIEPARGYAETCAIPSGLTVAPSFGEPDGLRVEEIEPPDLDR